MYEKLFTSVDLLNKGMQAAWLRNEVITNNIANVDTVGFKASNVEFESLFSEALVASEAGGRGELAVTNERHISARGPDLDSVQPRVVTEEDNALRYDENDVDIEQEMIELARNSANYYALVSKVNSEFRKLGTAINNVT